MTIYDMTGTPNRAGIAADTAARRKARGAFFTPPAIAQFIADWAVRDGGDRVLEPSAGDAEFMVAAAARLRTLGTGDGRPTVHGVEIHPASAALAVDRMRAVGAEPELTISDFFAVEPDGQFDAVIGNPPYIRFQDFAGENRARARRAALQAGVALSGLASSWAAFAVHSTSFLRTGGRLGLVLPGELLSVNYAAPVRRHLLSRFASVELVLFDEQVFPEAETEVVLVLADGFGDGPADHAVVRTVRDAQALAEPGQTWPWVPADPGGKWTGGLVDPAAVAALDEAAGSGQFAPLREWGETTLGMVTGNNRYFALSPERAAALGLPDRELLPISPPGSAHLRGLELSRAALAELGRAGKASRLFVPGARPSAAAKRYIAAGETLGYDTTYKCRVRTPWYRVPLLEPADLLLTCMNADTPRLTSNSAGVRHLNSVHGVYLRDAVADTGRRLLPLASLNSVTLLHAELTGRSYGGGILKIEPGEADQWLQPSVATVVDHAEALEAIRESVRRALADGDLLGAVELVDAVLFDDSGPVGPTALASVREARSELADRRSTRGRRRG